MSKPSKEVIAMATYDAAVLVAGGDVALAVEALVSAIVHASLQASSPKMALGGVIAHLETVAGEMPEEPANFDLSKSS